MLNLYHDIHLLALEYVDVNKRSLIANMMIAVGQTLAGCAEPWILKALEDWKPFFLINAAPVALVFITPLYVLNIPLLMKTNASHGQPSYHCSCVFESVRWLVSQGKVSRAVKIIKTIAKFNGRKVTEDVFESFEVPSQSESKLTGTYHNYLHSQRFAVSQQETFQQQEKKNVLTLFKSRRLRNRTILTIIAW